MPRDIEKALKKSLVRETISVKIDFAVMEKVRRVLYRRKAIRKYPWSQADAFTDAMKEWLKRNPK